MAFYQLQQRRSGTRVVAWPGFYGRGDGDESRENHALSYTLPAREIKHKPNCVFFFINEYVLCVFRCRQNWRRGFGSGRLRVTWGTVNDGVRCSLKAARSLRYPSWTNPAPKSSRPQRQTPSRPATSRLSEERWTAQVFTSRVTTPAWYLDNVSNEWLNSRTRLMNV